MLWLLGIVSLLSGLASLYVLDLILKTYCGKNSRGEGK